MVYAKAKAAMDAGAKFTMKLTDGQSLEYRIIGINHDDLADGSGKAGLTFLTTSMTISSRMNATKSSVGGWEASELRAKINSGEIWNLMPADFQSKVKAVKKFSNNLGGGDKNKNAMVTATSDKLFLLSHSEIVPTSYWASSNPWTSSEGIQYEAFRGKVTNNHAANSVIAIGGIWWERTVPPSDSTRFSLSAPTAIRGAATARRTLIASAPLGASSPVHTYRRPAQDCAGLSFGNRANGLRFLAQVIGLRKNGVAQRLSERLPHSPAITSAASSYRSHPACVS